MREVVSDGDRPGVAERVTGEVVKNIDAAACERARAVEPAVIGLVEDAEEDDETVEGPPEVGRSDGRDSPSRASA